MTCSVSKSIVLMCYFLSFCSSAISESICELRWKLRSLISPSLLPVTFSALQLSFLLQFVDPVQINLCAYNNNRQHSRNTDNHGQFSLTANKIPWFSLNKKIPQLSQTFQVRGGNPDIAMRSKYIVSNSNKNQYEWSAACVTDIQRHSDTF